MLTTTTLKTNIKNSKNLYFNLVATFVDCAFKPNSAKSLLF